MENKERGLREELMKRGREIFITAQNDEIEDILKEEAEKVIDEEFRYGGRGRYY